jgi:hypothetical protein
MEREQYLAYMRDYNQKYKYSRKPRPKDDYRERFNHSHLKIEPDENNFIGTDENEPQVCKTFSCKNHLSIEERRFGDICVHCQEKK